MALYIKGWLNSLSTSGHNRSRGYSLPKRIFASCVLSFDI